MKLTPQLFIAKVMHKRMTPKVNAFAYGVYYLAFPFAQRHDYHDGWRFGSEHRALLSFYDEDHGSRQKEGKLEDWLNDILKQHGLTKVIDQAMLITLPRVFGYVFNPVSFWLCFDASQQLRAVVCEVNNTFGETHSYLCAHEDHRVILPEDSLLAEKLFHVSPFMQRDGRYRFRFDVAGDSQCGIWIDYEDEEGNPKLLTALTGTLLPLNRTNLRKAFWKHPLVTFKTIFLIHWQAIKIILKGIRYVAKPEQRKERLSATEGLTKV
jgi:DUF1365 family protein